MIYITRQVRTPTAEACLGNIDIPFFFILVGGVAHVQQTVARRMYKKRDMQEYSSIYKNTSTAYSLGESVGKTNKAYVLGSWGEGQRRMTK